MKIHFCRSRNVGGWLIQLLTFSKWNHVAIEIDGIVYESVAFKGVQMSTYDSFRHNWSQIETVGVSAKDSEAAEKFLEAQLGKPYDYLAIPALPFRADWQDTRKWFCSELAAEALVKAGYPKFRIASWRITPRDLWLILD